MDIGAFALGATLLGGVFLIGLGALVRIRKERRERLQMKRHLQNIEIPGV